MKWLILFFPLLSYGQVMIDIDQSKLLHTTDKRFLSFALDTAQIVGSYWWDESGEMTGGRGKYRTEPFNFQSEKLKNMTNALAPAYFRIGGSEADAVYYDLTGKMKTPPPGYDSLMTKTQWDNLHQFTQDTGLDLFFTLNVGPSSWKNGKWDSSNAHSLIKYAAEQGHKVGAWELGNEVLAFWATFWDRMYY
jgi:heparanase 1